MYLGIILCLAVGLGATWLGGLHLAGTVCCDPVLRTVRALR